MHVYININMVHALSPLGSSVRGTKGGWNLREQTWQFISGVNMQTCPKANHMMQSLSQFNFLSSNSSTKTFSTCCVTHMHHRTKKNLAHRTFSQPRVGEEDTTTGWAFGSMQNSLFDELCQNECLYHQSVLFDMYVLFQAFTNENLARSITNL